ncbi:ABC transporter ATP-binding protein [Roseiconus nitratireducens]|uniref:ABC transporter ATP-binding protein n=2 Tax=Roseiconus nitratireducens TaxID=2605748 RepID=A0A5M6DPH3_9BACT|nr:ABC transporter ATP-binding protein [Roseiconus nitratireducens]
MSAASSIECCSVGVAFGRNDFAVSDLTLHVGGGEIISLIGPSGCGKTTLLRAIAGLQPMTVGRVEMNPPADTSRGQIGFVFQQPSLLPWATALENVQLPLDIIGRGQPQERRRAALDALRSVKLADAGEKRPHELSGGMQMRTSIARALVTDPSVLLLDEPFAALDDMLRGELGELLLSLWDQRRFTAVMVTHNIAESILLSRRIAVMRGGILESVLENPIPWPRDQSQMRTAEFAAFFGVVSDHLRGAVDNPGRTPDGV